MIDADGSEFKSNLGANAILSVSLAVAKAGARAMKIPLHQYFNDMYENISETNSQGLDFSDLNQTDGGSSMLATMIGFGIVLSAKINHKQMIA